MYQSQHPDQPQLDSQQHFELSFTLASFEQTIKHNFQLVQKLLEQHQRSIDRLELNVQGLSANHTPQNTTTLQLQAKETDTAKIEIAAQEGQQDRMTQINQQHEKTEGAITANGHAKQEHQSGSVPITKMELSFNGMPHPSQEQSLHQSEYIDPTKTRQDHISKEKLQEYKEIQQQSFSNNEKEAYEAKMFELFERVRKLEEKEIMTIRQENKKYKEFEFALESCNRGLERAQKSQESCKDEIEKLRNELSEYKLKKEAKINKLLHSNSLSQSSIGNENFDYIAEKLQFLLKHVKELLNKKTFEDERDLLQQQIEALRKKLQDTISQNFLEESLKNSEAKIYSSVLKYIKSIQYRQNRPEQDEQGQPSNQLEQMLAEQNRELNQKVSLQQEKLKQITDTIEGIQTELNLSRKEKLQTEQQINEQFKTVFDDQRMLQRQLSALQRTQQETRQDFTQKHVETQAQIIELQEQVEKLSSQLKTYTYSDRDQTTSPLKNKATPEKRTNSLLEMSSQIQTDKNNHENSMQGSTLEQQISLLKKKVSKMGLKIQGVKEDLLAVRKDFNQELDNIKMNLEKKADWQSLKNTLNYFDEKMKETKAVLQHLYNSFDRGEGNGDDSLAVKKGWTCLMCDRDIKNYEGKISEAKFTSMFPVRESPRIGGYFKQQQMSQDYKHVFLNNPVNNRTRRVGSLRSNPTNQSKEQLYG